jgi:hypothetical protein
MTNSNFRTMKYGMFVHYVAKATCRPDGSIPATADETADGFDAEGFANDLATFGVEYVLFTAWHYNAHCLYPSAANDTYMSGHSVRRDMIGDMIRAVKAKGIAVLLYTHPRDGHDFSEADAIATGWGAGGKCFHGEPNPATFNQAKWNDFINGVYAEVVDRYGQDILGVYLDESCRGNSDRILDYNRLRRTIKSRNPDLFMLTNYYGNLYCCDMGDKEYAHWDEFASSDGRVWPSNSMPIAAVIANSWLANTARGKNVVTYSAEDMFRYTVLQAGSCIDGGGVQWAAGPYVGGGWETGVAETMTALGKLIAPIAPSIKNTLPSLCYRTHAGSTIDNLTWGVATRSADADKEYLHVLKAPEGRTLHLPPTHFGKRYRTSRLLANGHAVDLVQSDAGLSVNLRDGDVWDPLDTVIELTWARELG